MHPIAYLCRCGFVCKLMGLCIRKVFQQWIHLRWEPKQYVFNLLVLTNILDTFGIASDGIDNAKYCGETLS